MEIRHTSLKGSWCPKLPDHRDLAVMVDVLSRLSDPLQLHGPQPTSLLCSWDSPGKNTGVGCHAFLQGIFSTQGWNPSLWRVSYIAGKLFTSESLGKPPVMNDTNTYRVRTSSIQKVGGSGLPWTSSKGESQKHMLATCNRVCVKTSRWWVLMRWGGVLIRDSFFWKKKGGRGVEQQF